MNCHGNLKTNSITSFKVALFPHLFSINIITIFVFTYIYSYYSYLLNQWCYHLLADFFLY